VSDFKERIIDALFRGARSELQEELPEHTIQVSDRSRRTMTLRITHGSLPGARVFTISINESIRDNPQAGDGAWTAHGHWYGTGDPDYTTRPLAIARCGGPAICAECAREAFRRDKKNK
jgi:hypothetical protein